MIFKKRRGNEYIQRSFFGARNDKGTSTPRQFIHFITLLQEIQKNTFGTRSHYSRSSCKEFTNASQCDKLTLRFRVLFTDYMATKS